MTPGTQDNRHVESMDCMASVFVEADGRLRLDGPWQDVLARDMVERNEVLSNIACTASVGDVICLPITGAMVSAWLLGIAAEEGGDILEQLGESSRTLSQTLLVCTHGTQQCPQNLLVTEPAFICAIRQR